MNQFRERLAWEAREREDKGRGKTRGEGDKGRGKTRGEGRQGDGIHIIMSTNMSLLLLKLITCYNTHGSE